MFSSRFMLFPTFLENKTKFRGGGEIYDHGNIYAVKPMIRWNLWLVDIYMQYPLSGDAFI